MISRFKVFGVFLLIPLCISAQSEQIPVAHEPVPGVNWEGGEKDYYSNIWQNQVITNVSDPVMEVFYPPADQHNGAAVVIAPGGGLYALSIESEGREVARWLNQKGFTAFVLKYRLVPSGEDGVKEITVLSQQNPAKIMEEVTKVMPYSVQDGLNAISQVRTHSEKYKINPDKIGFMGFSAGGAVTMGVTYRSEAANRPDFVVPVYAWTTAYPVEAVPEDAPPMLVICASDDPLGLAPGSVELYSSWLEAGKIAGLHMYSTGGHGFGMKKQNLPSDQWISRFYDWSRVHILNDSK